MGNPWPCPWFEVRSQWGKEAKYKPVTTLTSQILGLGTPACAWDASSFDQQEVLEQKHPTRGLAAPAQVFLLIFVKRTFCSCFCCCGCVRLRPRTCRFKCTILYRIMLQPLKSMLLVPNLFWPAGVKLSSVHSSVRNWKTSQHLLANVCSCHFSLLDNDLKFPITISLNIICVQARRCSYSEGREIPEAAVNYHSG